MDIIPTSFYQDKPDILTILTTYRCNAACAECCFESNPKVKGRLSLREITKQINDAHEKFKSLKLVVFSGGECFLLKNDLYKSIKEAASLNLMTRCVTNGFWGKTRDNSEKVADMLQQSGLTEINFSTGLDHQKWVPIESVVNSAISTSDRDIFTLITVEKDTQDSDFLEKIINHTKLKEKIYSGKILVQSNSWMPFRENHIERGEQLDSNTLRKGCDQVFKNVVVTPHNLLSACCGLTLEHIPEMKLGDLGSNSIETLYNSQKNDFLKHWIHTDGPYAIIEKVMGSEFINNEMPNFSHICQACVFLHKDERIVKKLKSEYKKYIPETVFKISLNTKVGNNNDQL
ncbi:radical SAM protein [Aestuariibacter sp. AA17]|uniref:Radical SAM protein n=1 Tax=Fluctibacter corallii TaxID=2984329 RepID=A0ABT3AC48_9ALTE|nr:radical SAM protein [Aestuariibacter sp. AA17]MCV2886251.1 radical SAM protein [Aestuariibacter sp. AA17]